jgi:hypothetical protein
MITQLGVIIGEPNDNPFIVGTTWCLRDFLVSLESYRTLEHGSGLRSQGRDVWFALDIWLGDLGDN